MYLFEKLDMIQREEKLLNFGSEIDSFSFTEGIPANLFVMTYLCREDTIIYLFEFQDKTYRDAEF